MFVGQINGAGSGALGGLGLIWPAFSEITTLHEFLVLKALSGGRGIISILKLRKLKLRARKSLAEVCIKAQLWVCPVPQLHSALLVGLKLVFPKHLVLGSPAVGLSHQPDCSHVRGLGLPQQPVPFSFLTLARNRDVSDRTQHGEGVCACACAPMCATDLALV